MDWKTEIDGYISELKSIVALLFSLAFIADRAALGSISMRRDLLDIIWPAELSALRTIHLAAFDLGVPMQQQEVEPKDTPPLAVYGDAPVDARNLAVRLRALAFILAYLVLLAQRIARAVAACPQDWPALVALRTGRPATAPAVFRPSAAPQPAIRAPPFTAVS